MSEKSNIKQFGGEWALILLSLLIAFLIWFLYTLSVSYSAFFEYEVEATTNIEGHAPVAIAEEVLVLRGRGPGFSILKNRLYRSNAEKIRLQIDASLFDELKDSPDTFSISKENLFQPLVKELGKVYEVEYIETESLRFVFPSQTYKKVPLVAQSDVSFDGQYMQVGDLVLSPDSVTVYGATEDLVNLNSVNTRIITLNGVNKTVHGIVQIEPLKGFRIAEDHASYTINVSRFVENKATVTLEVINLPAGTTLTIIPSQITVYYRIPFNSREVEKSDAPSFVVDYKDYISSRYGVVVPKLLDYSGMLLSYRLEPQVVECILTN
ncbi:MAG: hypothetical protein IJS02_05590 [Bacteroidales bacterium]|nr:hypothetical protein [Bacteroidales bacterium]